MKLARFRACLALSLTLHLSLLLLLSMGKHPSTLGKAMPSRIEVRLAEAPTPVPATTSVPPEVAAPPPVQKPQSMPDTGTPRVGDLSRKARFVEDPGLSELESVAVPIAGSLTLRIQVSQEGSVERVEIVKSSATPADLLEGAVIRLKRARLSPALSTEGKPVPSSLDIVVHFEPSPIVAGRSQ